MIHTTTNSMVLCNQFINHTQLQSIYCNRIHLNWIMHFYPVSSVCCVLNMRFVYNMQSNRWNLKLPSKLIYTCYCVSQMKRYPSVQVHFHCKWWILNVTLVFAWRARLVFVLFMCLKNCQSLKPAGFDYRPLKRPFCGWTDSRIIWDRLFHL